jgi:hypothetical protein
VHPSCPPQVLLLMVPTLSRGHIDSCQWVGDYESCAAVGVRSGIGIRAALGGLSPCAYLCAGVELVDRIDI